GRYVRRRAETGATRFHRGVSGSRAAVHAAPQGQGRHYGMGSGERLAREYVDREAHRVRSLLHPELVLEARLQDYGHDALVRIRTQERVLNAWLASHESPPSTSSYSRVC